MTNETQHIARVAWREEALSIREIGERLDFPMSASVVGRTLRALGFRRDGEAKNSRKRGVRLAHYRWKQGPCVECLELYRADEMEHGVCAVCLAPPIEVEEPLTPAETIRELHGVCLATERAKHRERMRERYQGIRDTLPDPCYVRSGAGYPVRTKIFADR